MKCFGVSVTCLLLVVFTITEINSLVPQVTIPSGTVRGYYDVANNGKRFAAFEGIPYARPPLGKYRFREPQPLKPWKGVWVANSTVQCIQYDHFLVHTGEPVFGEEDCLHVNVYSPQLSQTSLLDVIVFIHGGAFMFGTGYTNKPHYLLENDIVFVTLNYRLGPLGFLSTEDDVVPGNNGLKDQNAALKWVRDNIQYFGGNPESVTIIGHSAGGASVSYHYLSPMSAGLFHRGYAVSGIALVPWAQTEGSLEKAKKLAASVGCDHISNRDMVDCMRYRPAYQIVSNIKLFFYYLYNPFSPFGPVVDKGGLNPFLSEAPYNLLRQGKVYDAPLIVSATQAEGLYPGGEFMAKPSYLPEIEQRWEELAPHLFDYNYTVPKVEHASVAQKIKTYYLKNQPVSKATFNQLIQAIGDRLFVVDLELGAKSFAKAMTSPVYFMYFSYRGELSKSKILTRLEDDFGVCHGDDLMYVFKYNWTPELTSENDKLAKSIQINSLLTFAKTGVPTFGNVQPTPVSKTKGPLDYLHFEAPTQISVKTADSLSQRQFWNALPFDENKITIQVKEEL